MSCWQNAHSRHLGSLDPWDRIQVVWLSGPCHVLWRKFSLVGGLSSDLFLCWGACFALLETRPHRTALPKLELIIQTRLASNLRWSSFFCLPALVYRHVSSDPAKSRILRPIYLQRERTSRSSYDANPCRFFLEGVGHSSSCMLMRPLDMYSCFGLSPLHRELDHEMYCGWAVVTMTSSSKVRDAPKSSQFPLVPYMDRSPRRAPPTST